MKKLAIPLLALVLAGCTGNPKVDWIITLANTCEAYGSALKVLSIRRDAGKLTPPQVRSVNRARKLVNPICKPGSIVASPRDAFLSINGSVGELVAMKGE